MALCFLVRKWHVAVILWWPSTQLLLVVDFKFDVSTDILSLLVTTTEYDICVLILGGFYYGII